MVEVTYVIHDDLKDGVTVHRTSLYKSGISKYLGRMATEVGTEYIGSAHESPSVLSPFSLTHTHIEVFGNSSQRQDGPARTVPPPGHRRRK